MRSQRIPSILRQVPQRWSGGHASLLRTRCPRPLLQAMTRHESTHHHQITSKPRWQRFEDESEHVSLKPIRPRNPMDYVGISRLVSKRNVLVRRRILLLLVVASGLVGVQVFMMFMFDDPESAKRLQDARRQRNGGERMDAPVGKDAAALAGASGVVVHEKPGNPEILIDEFGNELVPTGSDTEKHFPRTITLPTGIDSQEEEEYTLIGVGPRTITFLYIPFEVYVGGIYIRTSDLNDLQARFINHINPSGSSLIPHEKEQLKSQLLSDDRSFAIWNDILTNSHLKSCLRIVSTYGNTQTSHLRSGWAKSITKRTKALSSSGQGAAYEDESFEKSMHYLNTRFGAGPLRGNQGIHKGNRLLLLRDDKGELQMWYQRKWEPKRTTGDKGEELPRPPKFEYMDKMDDERVSRLVWTLYLGGKDVSSEPLRKSVVDGVIDLVGRPAGTLTTRVI